MFPSTTKKKTCEGFHKWGYPKIVGWYWKTPLKRMIWGINSRDIFNQQPAACLPQEAENPARCFHIVQPISFRSRKLHSQNLQQPEIMSDVGHRGNSWKKRHMVIWLWFKICSRMRNSLIKTKSIHDMNLASVIYTLHHIRWHRMTTTLHEVTLNKPSPLGVERSTCHILCTSQKSYDIPKASSDVFTDAGGSQFRPVAVPSPWWRRVGLAQRLSRFMSWRPAVRASKWLLRSVTEFWCWRNVCKVQRCCLSFFVVLPAMRCGSSLARRCCMTMCGSRKQALRMGINFLSSCPSLHRGRMGTAPGSSKKAMLGLTLLSTSRLTSVTMVPSTLPWTRGWWNQVSTTTTTPLMNMALD